MAACSYYVYNTYYKTTDSAEEKKETEGLVEEPPVPEVPKA